MAKQRSRRLGSPNRTTNRTGRNPLHIPFRGGSNLLGNSAFVLLGLAVLGLIAVIALATAHTPVLQSSSAQRQSLDASNGRPGTDDWIPLHSNAPGDIIAAARRSELFNERGGAGGDHVTNISRLGAPVLVLALQPPGAAPGAYPDFYVLPILDNKGATTDAAELQLNANHTAIKVIAIVSYTQPRAQGAIPHMDSAKARGALNAQHRMAQADTTLTLVYFPGDAVAQETGKVTWTGGGEFPADPIWLMPGADGKDYVVGTDGRVYDISQLPMAPSGN